MPTSHTPFAAAPFLCETTSNSLSAMLRPRSVAVIGASHRAGSVGAAVMSNLLQSGFGGAAALAALSRLIAEHPGVLEADANPVLVTPDDATVLDARVVVGSQFRTMS